MMCHILGFKLWFANLLQSCMLWEIVDKCSRNCGSDVVVGSCKTLMLPAEIAVVDHFLKPWSCGILRIVYKYNAEL